MFSIDMSLEWNSLFLELLSGNIANVTVILLIVSKRFVYFSELCKRVKHNTRNNAAE